MMRTIFAAVSVLLFFGSSALAEALEGKRSPSDILEASDASDWRALDPENLMYIELERGRVIVAFSTQLAQAHVEQVKTLTRDAYYDGLSFYRVIDGFVAQGGDAFGTRDLKSAKQTLRAEFEQPLTDDIDVTLQSDADGYASKIGWVDSLPVGIDEKDKSIWHLHCPGTFAFGRNNEKDSAATEFYITLQAQRYLDRNTTVFGRVVQGMEHIQALRRVSPPSSEDDDLGEKILSMRIVADMPIEEQVSLEILSSSSDVFSDYIESRRNRSEAFFYYRHDYMDICQLAVPVRAASTE